MREQDSIVFDSLAGRPLPGWLMRQKQGLNTYTPEKLVMKEDRSIETSLIITGAIILIVIGLMTIYFIRKKK